ncbi:MAG: ABC transporter ATP-binding protein [bacterium]
MTNKNNILNVLNLGKVYRKTKTPVYALQNVNFKVSEGHFISVVGRSGSGKSTLLNLIGGLDTPTFGAVEISGKDLAQMNKRELTYHRRFTVGMIFQSFNLISSLSALENVALASMFANVPRKKRKTIATNILHTVGLGERTDHTPSELSGGEAQRVAIARALINNPAVLLADEPTGNLDSITAREIISLLQHLNHKTGITVIMVTHDEIAAKEISDHMYTLLDGKIVEHVSQE